MKERNDGDGEEEVLSVENTKEDDEAAIVRLEIELPQSNGNIG